MALFSSAGLEFLFAWTHFLSGVTWIGLLYYFNFVQGAYFKETDAAAKTAATKLLVPRALWWFRWAALVTFLSGAAILTKWIMDGGMTVLASSRGILITVGALLGTLMFLNVWGIIWRNQKIVIAAANGQNIGDAAKAGARALVASRTNTMFSIPMLFFMGGASRLPLEMNPEMGHGMFWGAILVIIGALEINSIKGKLGPLETTKGVISCGFVLAAALYACCEVLL